MGTRSQQQPGRERVGQEDDDMAGGQSVSMSGSVGSPSSRSEQTMATPAGDNSFLRLNHPDVHGDDAGSQGAVGSKKKKRGQRAVAGDKNGRGLRQFSMKVCEKVESKGRTTYNEVADELVAEFADPSNAVTSPDQQQQDDEKNIRRRVYDALNVLMAMDIISKDKKEIQWKGLPRTSLNDIEELKTERMGLRNRIEKKAAYLQELEEQYVGLQNLIQRNEELYHTGDAPSGGVALPFILVQTRPHATVEVEISEDMQLVHFDFNRQQSDDATQNLTVDGGEGCSMSGMYQPQIPLASMNTPVRAPPMSPPRPGILKSRVKHEHHGQ
ncbi:transcription factor-like protein DPB isoform X4 [Pyrus x bretschneideri]|uniref:transcription factor-like protein DPB isoform X4 n=1 Tax=Pyrus x bretschneideri TaxID=225117 RepID=UPI0020309F8E|nr:transcription factor-like protein DPB isoform X4 [Pyrus x bretschneideri]